MPHPGFADATSDRCLACRRADLLDLPVADRTRERCLGQRVRATGPAAQPVVIRLDELVHRPRAPRAPHPRSVWTWRRWHGSCTTTRSTGRSHVRQAALRDPLREVTDPPRERAGILGAEQRGRSPSSRHRSPRCRRRPARSPGIDAIDALGEPAAPPRPAPRACAAHRSTHRPRPGVATEAPAAVMTVTRRRCTSRCQASITQPVNRYALASLAGDGRETPRSDRAREAGQPEPPRTRCRRCASNRQPRQGERAAGDAAARPDSRATRRTARSPAAPSRGGVSWSCGPSPLHQVAERHRRRARGLACPALDARIHRAGELGRPRVRPRAARRASPRGGRGAMRSRGRSRGRSGSAAGTARTRRRPPARPRRAASGVRWSSLTTRPTSERHQRESPRRELARPDRTRRVIRCHERCVRQRAAEPVEPGGHRPRAAAIRRARVATARAPASVVLVVRRDVHRADATLRDPPCATVARGHVRPPRPRPADRDAPAVRAFGQLRRRTVVEPRGAAPAASTSPAITLEEDRCGRPRPRAASTGGRAEPNVVGRGRGARAPRVLRSRPAPERHAARARRACRARRRAAAAGRTPSRS